MYLDWNVNWIFTHDAIINRPETIINLFRKTAVNFKTNCQIFSISGYYAILFVDHHPTIISSWFEIQLSNHTYDYYQKSIRKIVLLSISNPNFPMKCYFEEIFGYVVLKLKCRHWCLKWLQDSLALKDGILSNQIWHSLCMLTEFTPIMAGCYFSACHSENVKANP